MHSPQYTYDFIHTPVCEQMKHKNKQLSETVLKLEERVSYYEEETDPETQAVLFLESLRDIFIEVGAARSPALWLMTGCKLSDFKRYYPCPVFVLLTWICRPTWIKAAFWIKRSYVLS